MYINFTFALMLFELCVKVVVTDNSTFSKDWDARFDGNNSFQVPGDTGPPWRPMFNFDDLMTNLLIDLPCLSCKGRCGNATILNNQSIV